MNITEDFIAEITGLSMKGNKFYRDRAASNTIKFFKGKERAMLRGVGTSGYDQKSIKPLWRDVALGIMKFFTLEGRYSIIYGYHFMLLNHFRQQFGVVPLLLAYFYGN